MSYTGTTRYGYGWTDSREVYSYVEFDADVVAVLNIVFDSDCSVDTAIDIREVQLNEVFSAARRAEIRKKLENENG